MKKRIKRGFIFQYSLSGCGIYEDEMGIHRIERDMAFITCVPNDCKYYLPDKKMPNGSSCIFILTEWINENYETEISVADLSKKVGLTPSYLSRFFYKQLGVKPNEYITNVRLQKSMQLLTTSTIEINDIALMCGFAD